MAFGVLILKYFQPIWNTIDGKF